MGAEDKTFWADNEADVGEGDRRREEGGRGAYAQRNGADALCGCFGSVTGMRNKEAAGARLESRNASSWCAAHW